MTRQVVAPTLDVLLEAVSDALDISRAVIIPGMLTPWDCEQVWVRLISLQPVYNQGVPQGSGRCGPMEWQAQVGIGAIRCVATLDDRGNPPKAPRMTSDAHRILADAEAMESALECLQSPLVQDMRIMQYESQGAEGAYAGGEWTVTLRLPNCTDCP